MHTDTSADRLKVICVDLCQSVAKIHYAWASSPYVICEIGGSPVVVHAFRPFP